MGKFLFGRQDSNVARRLAGKFSILEGCPPTGADQPCLLGRTSGVVDDKCGKASKDFKRSTNVICYMDIVKKEKRYLG